MRHVASHSARQTQESLTRAGLTVKSEGAGVSAQTRLITKSLMIVANQCIVRGHWLYGTGLQ